ncbi:PhoH-like phosphate starvation-inducible [Escherichia phage vB_vPM_PD06]|jgi:predicted ribonuclease YlaK|uniref:Phi92_gp060 n=6 Tax=Justusliebigvirus TaxID=2948775 RepID=I7HJC3_9CAUD|nr:PhoH-like phosphate starvation-inducible [Escherichia phage phi92]YP_009984422.1 PhoH-like phosphate starvation-inducible [Escherichia phage vB_EcoM_PHB05]YP_009984783.1 PhoH-like phosphate starvation-inducible [Escherichia phage vB_vPM_PD06]YP_009985288.1 PhoH-like phosphate starvation-inducible [Escherichia phage alia]YP_009985677.1 PhoH-like phosphate starvation-inducible [Escherichia phage muut]AMM43397.1 putative cytoplasmic PhoH protein [Enterobacteria phage ECGD1]AXY81420.1 hypothet
MGNKTAKARRQSAANDDKRASRYAAKAVGNDDYRLDEFTPVGNQEAIVRSMVWNDLTIVNAPAGTGKTTTALWKALQMLKAGDFRKLIFLKNPTEVGDDQIGFLSGDKTDKLAAHYESTKRIFQQFMTANKLENDIASGKIELNIPNYALGATWDNSIILIDEVQLMSPNTVKLLLERAGLNTRIVIMGDVNQTYAIKRRANGLGDLLDRVVPINEEGEREAIVDFIGYVEMTTADNQRSRLSQFITEVY